MGCSAIPLSQTDFIKYNVKIPSPRTLKIFKLENLEFVNLKDSRSRTVIKGNLIPIQHMISDRIGTAVPQILDYDRPCSFKLVDRSTCAPFQHLNI